MLRHYVYTLLKLRKYLALRCPEKNEEKLYYTHQNPFVLCFVTRLILNEPNIAGKVLQLQLK